MAGFDLPPLMLTQHESEALMVAIRLLKTWGGDSLSQALESAQEKCWRYCRQRVGAEPSKRGFSRQILVISRIHAVRSISYIARFQLSRCWRCIIAMSPGISRGATFSRWVYFFWGEHWLLVGWCEKRDDYRCFRVDRCLKITPLDRHFRESADRSLSDFYVKYAVKTSHKKPAVKLACLR